MKTGGTLVQVTKGLVGVVVSVKVEDHQETLLHGLHQQKVQFVMCAHTTVHPLSLVKEKESTPAANHGSQYHIHAGMADGMYCGNRGVILLLPHLN